jgi:hypothetical protein
MSGLRSTAFADHKTSGPKFPSDIRDIPPEIASSSPTALIMIYIALSSEWLLTSHIRRF